MMETSNFPCPTFRLNSNKSIRISFDINSDINITYIDVILTTVIFIYIFLVTTKTMDMHHVRLLGELIVFSYSLSTWTVGKSPTPLSPSSSSSS